MQRQVKWIVAVIALVPGVTLLARQGKPELVSTIAFSSWRQDPLCNAFLAAEVFLMSPDDINAVQRLTHNDGCTHADTFAALSPEGKNIVFDSNRLTTNTGFLNITDLFLMRSDGTELTLLTRGSSATWSPHGKNVAFHASASYHASGGMITLSPTRTDPGGPDDRQ